MDFDDGKAFLSLTGVNAIVSDKSVSVTGVRLEYHEWKREGRGSNERRFERL